MAGWLEFFVSLAFLDRWRPCQLACNNQPTNPSLSLDIFARKRTLLSWPAPDRHYPHISALTPDSLFSFLANCKMERLTDYFFFLATLLACGHASTMGARFWDRQRRLCRERISRVHLSQGEIGSGGLQFSLLSVSSSRFWACAEEKKEEGSNRPFNQVLLSRLECMCPR